MSNGRTSDGSTSASTDYLTITTGLINTSTGTLTLPASTDTLVGRATTDTLTNKTISGATLSGNTTVSGPLKYTGSTPSNGYILTSDSTGNATWQSNGITVTPSSTTTFTNKTLTCGSNVWADPTDSTKKIGFAASAATTGTTLVLASTAGSSGTVSFPGATDTVALLAMSQSLSNKTLVSPIVSTGLQYTASPGASYLLQSDSSGNATWSNPASNTLLTGAFAPISTTVTLTGTQTLSNKSLTTPGISFSGNTISVPLSLSGNDTWVFQSTSQTLSGKTIQHANGSVSAPSCAFGSSNNSGLYYYSGGATGTGIAATGNTAATIDTTGGWQLYYPLTNSSQPCALYSNPYSSTQTISSGVLTTLTFATQILLQGSTISYSGGTFTVTNPGQYLVSFEMVWQYNSTYTRQCWITVGGSVRRGQSTTNGLTNSDSTCLSGSAIISCSSSTTLSISAYQDSGSSLGTPPSTFINYVSIIKLC